MEVLPSGSCVHAAVSKHVHRNLQSLTSRQEQRLRGTCVWDTEENAIRTQTTKLLFDPRLSAAEAECTPDVPVRKGTLAEKRFQA